MPTRNRPVVRRLTIKNLKRINSSDGSPKYRVYFEGGHGRRTTAEGYQFVHTIPGNEHLYEDALADVTLLYFKGQEYVIGVELVE